MAERTRVLDKRDNEAGTLMGTRVFTDSSYRTRRIYLVSMDHDRGRVSHLNENDAILFRGGTSS